MKDDFHRLRTAARPTAVKIAKEAKITQKTEDGQTLLFAAAGRPPSKGKSVDVCQILAERGLSCTQTTSKNESALFEAVRGENVETAKWLLDNGCDPNQRSCTGTTPLCIAFYESQLEMVFLLLNYGANPNYEDSSGRRPMLYADPIFRAAFLAAEAQGGVAPQINRKRRRSDDQPDPPYKKFKGVGAQNCKGHYYLRNWVFESEPHGDNGKIFRQEGSVYAANSNFVVQAAPVKAAPKIRGLQRELCENHADLFPELILACCPGEWASFIGVPEEEIDAQERMTALLTDAQRSDALEFVLAGVDARTRDICGYVHVRFYDKSVRICYLKVKNSYRGCGLGKMLVQAAIDASRQRGWSFSDVQLICHQSNARALHFYKSLGFTEGPCGKPKSRSIYRQWVGMRKKL